MNAKHIKKGIKPILTLFLFFSFTVFVFPQEKQSDSVEKLREEILAVYQTKGEQGLRDFFKKSKKQITIKFILDFAEEGLKERKEECLKTCEIMAEEIRDEKTLVDVYLKIGQYFLRINNFERANHFYDISIPICEKTNYVVGLGIAYQNKAFISLYIGNSNNAIEMFDKALQFFKKSKNVQGQGNVYMGKSQIYFHTGFYEKALEMLENALSFFKKSGDNLSLGNILKFKGDIYSYRGKNFAALELYDKALNYYKKEKELLSCGNTYFSKGRIYARTGNYFKAMNMYKNAQNFYNKAGSHIAFGNLYNGMGDLYLKRCKYSKADEFYEKALIYYEKAGEPRGQGNVYISKGDIYLLTGVNSKAIEMFKMSYRFFEKAGDVRGLGNVSYRKGDIYNYAGDNLKALLMYEEAINYFKKAKYVIGLNFVYIRKGDIFLGTGNLLKASEFYNKALLFFEKERDPLALGDLYHRKGIIYFLSEKYTDAIEMYEKALSFSKKAQMPLGMGDVYSEMGTAFLKTGMISKAFDMCQKAIFFHNKAKAPIALSNSYRVKGDIHFKRGQYLKAIEMYDKAIKFSKKIRDIKAESLALYEKAKVLAKLGKKNKALAFFEESIFNLEKIRGQTAFSEIKRTFWEMIFDQYEETVLFMLNNKFYDKSFKYAESMKSRVFLDQMSEGLVMLEKGLKSELREERDRLVGKLSALTRQMQETGVKDEKKLHELKDEYRRVESQFDDLLIKIRLDNPLYASVNYPQPVTVRDLQKDVLKKGETLLSYFISRENDYAFIVSKENFQVKQLKINEKEVNGYVERFLHSIKENNTNDMNKFGSKLYEKLFKPLEKYLKKSKEIIIVPAGKLETIPFESFIVSKKKQGHPVYLLEKYRIKYIQSASILSVLRKHYQRDSETQSFIGFGDPVYDYESFKQGKPGQGILTLSNKETDEIKEVHQSRYARAGGVLPRLRKSGEEVKAIANLFEKKSQKSAVYDREKATEEKAKAEDMKEFDFIHFACHGLLAEDFQSLVLSQDIPGSKDDGYFTLSEVMNCDYNAKLVVLSACQTGSGKMYKGEGVTGLIRAVMYAGTPAVLASLWKVDDTAAKELMIRFYTNMLEKSLDKTEALRQAKLELLKNKNYSSPLFWSAFVMYGE